MSWCQLVQGQRVPGLFQAGWSLLPEVPVRGTLLALHWPLCPLLLCYGQRSPLGAETLSLSSLQMTFLPTNLVPCPWGNGQVTRQAQSSLRNAAEGCTGSSTRQWGARAGVPGQGRGGMLVMGQEGGQECSGQRVERGESQEAKGASPSTDEQSTPKGGTQSMGPGD